MSSFLFSNPSSVYHLTGRMILLISECMQGDIHSVVETINQAIRKYEDGEICQLISHS